MKDLSVKLSKVSSSPDLDSEILLMKALRVSRAYLHTYNDKVISEFDTITLDGHSGEVFEGIAKTKLQEPTSDLKEILDWCKEIVSDEEIIDPLKIISKAKLKLE